MSPHDTCSRYVYGCRCDGCRAASNAYQREYRKRPEVKAKRREYRKRPEVKAKRREYEREYRKRPEVKAKRREYQREYQREYRRLAKLAKEAGLG